MGSPAGTPTAPPPPDEAAPLPDGAAPPPGQDAPPRDADSSPRDTAAPPPDGVTPSHEAPASDGVTPSGAAAPLPGEKGEAGEEDPPPDGRGARRGRRGRGTKITAAVALAVLAAGGAVFAVGVHDRGHGKAAASRLPPATAPVTRQTLNDTQSADGELGYGPTTAVAARLPGTLTRAPATGSTVTRGRALYEVDGHGVTLMYGTMPAYRTLSTDESGPDVRQLEQNLRALGYRGFTVDDDYTSATAAAVKKWQHDQGLARTGTVEFGRVVFAPGPVRIDSLDVGAGSPVAPGGTVLSYTGTAKAVTVDLDPADQRLARKGSAVGVELPDGGSVTGTVDQVSTVIQPASGQQAAQTKVEVVVGLHTRAAQRAADAYALAAVHVRFTAGTRRDVLTVPVAALVALNEGGFGVEVVEGTASRYVRVSTGLFADGRVEITGDGLTEGTKVGMPK